MLYTGCTTTRKRGEKGLIIWSYDGGATKGELENIIKPLYIRPEREENWERTRKSNNSNKFEQKSIPLLAEKARNGVCEDARGQGT